MIMHKHAWQLTALEGKANGITPLLLLLYAGILSIVFISDPNIYASMIADILFIALFLGVFTQFARTNYFKPQLIGQKIYTTQSILLYQQLPISMEIIATSRFYLLHIYNICFQLLFLIPYYFFSSSFQATMSIQTFIVFLIIWVSFGIYAGGEMIITDAGRPLTMRDRPETLKLIVQLIIVAAVFTLVYFFTSYSIIEWTIYIANTYPIAATIVSILFAVIGVRYWQAKMVQKLKETDYV